MQKTKIRIPLRDNDGKRHWVTLRGEVKKLDKSIAELEQDAKALHGKDLKLSLQDIMEIEIIQEIIENG